MTSQREKATLFKSLHRAGTPLVLYNVWDAGSAVAVADAGAKAVATGSRSVAVAQGYDDGQALPFEDVLRTARNVAEAVDLPCTIDFEGGYAVAPDKVADNVAKLAETGAIGMNFEDQIVGGEGLYSLSEQTDRIRAVRQRMNDLNIAFFINARTDVFLKAGPDGNQKEVLNAAKERAEAYAMAGADGFFAPGLAEASLIAELCDSCPLPVNIMRMPGVPGITELAGLGVARVSHGPGPYLKAMARLREDAGKLYGS